jgi:tetratricopeptide (TPR) repeat protein
MESKKVSVSQFPCWLTALAICFSLITTIPVTAQIESVAELREKVAVLLEQKNYIDAIPYLEKLTVATPNDPNIHFFLGIGLLAKATNLKDKASRKPLRVRARQAFVRSKELGNKEPLVEAFIQSLPVDGREGKTFSENDEANTLMEDGEAAFGKGDMDKAILLYQKALTLDPKIYEAALFTGDAYMTKNDFNRAETWYQKAISINPERETAYRYSATPLMKQGKYDKAKERYIEAFITEPYSRLALQGLLNWAKATNTRLAHPMIEIPASVKKNENGGLNITLGMGDKDDDGSFAWTIYALSRGTWQLGDDQKLSDKFKKAYPNETKYRHSLAEEAEALGLTVKTVKEQLNDKKSKIKKLNPSLKNLVKIYDEGLLEAYILLAMPDDGIVQDHPGYLKQNRDKLRKYMVDYVTKGGGN